MQRTHGLSTSKFYRKYQSIKRRCEDERSSNYKHYGAKGIKCLRNSFYEFQEDMYNSYYEHSQMYGEEDTTIDRIDNNRHYCKSNCRWATRKEQANNKSNNRKLTYRGKTDTLENRAKELGLTYTTLYQRLYKGMPFEFIAKHPDVKDVRICNEMLGKFGTEN